MSLKKSFRKLTRNLQSQNNLQKPIQLTGI